MCLPKSDNYQVTGVTNYIMSRTNSSCPHFFQEKVLAHRSEIHLLWRNIVSTGQSVWASNNSIQV